MANCNGDGPPEQYFPKVLNGVALPELAELPDEFDASHLAMPPRASADPFSMTTPVKHESESDFDTNLSSLNPHVPFLAQRSQSEDPNVILKLDPTAHKWNHTSNLAQRRSAYKDRMKSCAIRLKKAHARSTALFAKLLVINLSCVNSQHRPPPIVSRAVTEEDTESSTDDESSSDTISDLERHWFYQRALLCSQWHWLLTEVRRSKNTLKNLRLARASYFRWKSRINPLDPASQVDSSGCARRMPYTVVESNRPSIHQLDTLRKDNSLRKLRAQTDPFVQCSCLVNVGEPCIICCGSDGTSSRSVLHESQQATSLMGHMHPKLSVESDIPLHLRVESYTHTQAPNGAPRERIGPSRCPSTAPEMISNRRRPMIHPLSKINTQNMLTGTSPTELSDTETGTCFPSYRSGGVNTSDHVSPPHSVGRPAYSPSIVQRVFRSSYEAHTSQSRSSNKRTR